MRLDLYTVFQVNFLSNSPDSESHTVDLPYLAIILGNIS